MEWQQVNNWFMQSAEGYRISKAFTECTLPYAAWAPGSKTEHPAIGYAETPDKAKQLCDEHLGKAAGKKTHQPIKELARS